MALRRSTEFGRFAHELQLELRLPAQLVDQAGHGVAAIAGAHQERQADPVGFEFLLAGIAPERQQTIAGDRSADRDRAGHDRGLDGGVEHALPGTRALGGMVLGEMAQLMTESGGKLGLVIERGEKPARDEDVVRHGMGIGDRQIEHHETIAAAKARLADQLLADTVDIGLKRCVGIGRAHFALDLARQRGRAGLRRALAGCRGGRRRLRRIARQRAGCDTEEQRDKRQNTAKNH